MRKFHLFSDLVSEILLVLTSASVNYYPDLSVEHVYYVKLLFGFLSDTVIDFIYFSDITEFEIIVNVNIINNLPHYLDNG